MIPISLKITGFLSYRETVELDFTGFDLACISGHNGAGKSSLLDAITWSLFGQARKRDEALINTHPDIKAAEVIYTFFTKTTPIAFNGRCHVAKASCLNFRSKMVSSGVR